jgi:hypothetical protein
MHCGIDPSVWDFKGLINRALEVKVPNRQLRWYDWERYSARQETRIIRISPYQTLVLELAEEQSTYPGIHIFGSMPPRVTGDLFFRRIIGL